MTVVWEDATGLAFVEITVRPPSGYYPSFIDVEAEPMSLLTDDARSFAAALVKAADEADALAPKDTA